MIDGTARSQRHGKRVRSNKSKLVDADQLQRTALDQVQWEVLALAEFGSN